jgi:hypothetical protein
MTILTPFFKESKVFLLAWQGIMYGLWTLWLEAEVDKNRLKLQILTSLVHWGKNMNEHRWKLFPKDDWNVWVNFIRIVINTVGQQSIDQFHLTAATESHYNEIKYIQSPSWELNQLKLMTLCQ